ncbi:MmcQ/YjbR family DNA-binding protein [Tenacibaculum sp. SG-28]|uniref:MmcQ/YjbR family DNA-binding protein n=1 Tax=Tenacibaculum sp. SG-28 TaxID=754426 RepID=UPI000CF4E33E|nr:MmcQ/YjbR family DNA-binding protein [Tenacibaculum sp. SG-28]PQJ21043.1 MmcQ-like protein [Tenacibaculum sp. SG-28]
MNIEELHQYCSNKKGVTEHFPFDEVTLVFKVKGKMFALINLEKWERGETVINVKCKPTWSEELREEYEGVNPGFHMNKKHWNSLTINCDIPENLVLRLINHSYDLVVKKLPKKLKEELKEME